MSISTLNLWKQNDWFTQLQAPWSDSLSLLNNMSGLDSPLTLMQLNHSKTVHRLPYKFIAQKKKMKAISYYYSILSQREIPLKFNNHDFLNALMWLTFPKTRWNITQNQASYAHIRRQTNQSKRTIIEDRLTLFDESGLLLITDDPHCYQMIQDRSWFDLFWTHRTLCHQHVHCYIFGHGLYEQLLNPFIGLVGYGYVFYVPTLCKHWSHRRRLRYLDQKLSQIVLRETTLSLQAIPFLGLPYYWPQDRNFYLNTRYFRGPYYESS